MTFDQKRQKFPIAALLPTIIVTGHFRVLILIGGIIANMAPTFLKQTLTSLGEINVFL